MQRLVSYGKKVRSECYSRTGWISNPDDNPQKHPLPTLPGQEYLEGPYLDEIKKSNPGLLSRVLILIGLVKSVREGEIKYPSSRESIR